MFQVLDRQDSGNLCFGVEGPRWQGVRQVRPGASTIRDEGNRGHAIACERRARPSLSALAHPTLTQLLEAADIGDGHAMVFDWIDAVPLGRQYEQVSAAVRSVAVPTGQRRPTNLRFPRLRADHGWVAVNLVRSW